MMSAVAYYYPLWMKCYIAVYLVPNFTPPCRKGAYEQREEGYAKMSESTLIGNN